MITPGLYRTHFQTPLGAGAGVISFNGKTFEGGDSAIAYVGDISSLDGVITANIQTFRHSVGNGSVLGADSANFSVTGKATSEQSAELSGKVPGTAMIFSVKLDKISN